MMLTDEKDAGVCVHCYMDISSTAIGAGVGVIWFHTEGRQIYCPGQDLEAVVNGRVQLDDYTRATPSPTTGDLLLDRAIIQTMR